MELRRRRFHLSLDGPTDTAGVGWGRHGYVLGGGTYNRYKSLQKSMESALYCRIHRVYIYIYINIKLHEYGNELTYDEVCYTSLIVVAIVTL